MATLGAIPLIRWMIVLIISAGLFACPCAHAESTAAAAEPAEQPAHACCAKSAAVALDETPGPESAAHDDACPHCGRVLTATSTVDAGPQHLTAAELCRVEALLFAPLSPIVIDRVADDFAVPPDRRDKRSSASS